MEKTQQRDDLAYLEDRINRVLAGYAALKEERDRLLAQLKEKEEIVERLKNEIVTLQSERLEVRTRIEQLIERLEGIPLGD